MNPAAVHAPSRRQARHRAHFEVAAFFLLAWAMGAPATAAAGAPALAETLYQDGRGLMAAGRTAEACAKFEESLRLDAATGTLLNLAVCHEAQGKLATAWAEFRAAEGLASHDGRQDRVRLAREHLARLEPRLSYLTVVVPGANRPSDLEVKLDGTVLGPAAWNVATPVDPGNHIVEARSPGYTSLSRALTVGPNPARLSIDIALARDVALADAPATDQDHGAVVDTERDQSAKDASPLPPSKIPAYVAVGIGVAALALGATFGVRAFSRWSARNRECPMDACTPAGLTYSQEAETAALTANLAAGVGVAGLLIGGYLFYRAHARSAAPRPASPPAVKAPSTAALTPQGLVLGWVW